MFRRCTIASGEGLTIGSEMSGGVRNVTFEEITLEGTYIGIRMKSQRGRGGVVSGISYRNISMRNIATDCIRLNLNYHPDINRTNASATPVFKDILLALLLENIECTVNGGSRSAGGSSYLIEGLPKSQIRNLTLRNVQVARNLKEVTCVDVECTCDEATEPCPSCCVRTHRT